MKATVFTIIALIAFAANSLLCKMALAGDYINPWHFTAIRLLSGAVCLGTILWIFRYRKRVVNHATSNVSQDPIAKGSGSWLSSFCLIIYALFFSLAYVSLQTGTGALILFSAVQLTMIGWGIYKKEPLTYRQWLAFIAAMLGFVYLLLPSALMPSLPAAIMMSISGVAWGIYSIRGKRCAMPLYDTSTHFLRSVAIVPILLVIGWGQLSVDAINISSHINDIQLEGVLLAVASGALASGLGYSVWYVAIPLLKRSTAAIVQLCVPVLAALMGMLVLSEPITLRFMLSSAIILGAVLVFLLDNKTPNKNAVNTR